MPKKVTHPLLPARLGIDATVAASLDFGSDLTARDQSLLFAVSWYAAQHGLSDDGTVDIPDLPLRRALGNLRAPDIEKKAARFARLDQAVVRTDERLLDIDTEGVAAPVLEPGIRHMRIDGASRWVVDPALVTAFEPEAPDRMVSVPLDLLANARSRYTLPLFLRAAAWRHGEIEEHWLWKQNAAGIVLRLTPEELMRAVGYDASPEPRRFERFALSKAINEIERCSYFKVEYGIVRAPSLRRLDGGQIRFFEIMIGDTVLDKRPAKRKPAYIDKRSAPFFDAVRRRAAAKIVPISRPFEGCDDVDKPIEF